MLSQALSTTALYTLSLHDALPICAAWHHGHGGYAWLPAIGIDAGALRRHRRELARRGQERSQLPAVGITAFCRTRDRSEEHTSELQSLRHLVCRLLLEKKKKRE